MAAGDVLHHGRVVYFQVNRQCLPECRIEQQQKVRDAQPPIHEVPVRSHRAHGQPGLGAQGKQVAREPFAHRRQAVEHRPSITQAFLFRDDGDLLVVITRFRPRRRDLLHQGKIEGRQAEVAGRRHAQVAFDLPHQPRRRCIGIDVMAQHQILPSRVDARTGDDPPESLNAVDLVSALECLGQQRPVLLQPRRQQEIGIDAVPEAGQNPRHAG